MQEPEEHAQTTAQDQTRLADELDRDREKIAKLAVTDLPANEGELIAVAKVLGIDPLKIAQLKMLGRRP